MKAFRFDSPSEECSLLFGRKIGELLRAGDVVALRGELGAGKTLLTRGIARGLGISPEIRVTSPTFTIINEYSGGLLLHHIDLYRISGPDELETLPWQESLSGNAVAVIEWPERLDRLLPAKRWEIELAITGDDERRISLRALGRENRERLAEWMETLRKTTRAAPCLPAS